MHSFLEKNYQKGYETGEGSYAWRPGASLPSKMGTGIGTYLDIIPVPFGEMWCPRSLMQVFYKTTWFRQKLGNKSIQLIPLDRTIKSSVMCSLLLTLTVLCVCWQNYLHILEHFLHLSLLHNNLMLYLPHIVAILLLLHSAHGRMGGALLHSAHGRIGGGALLHFVHC